MIGINTFLTWVDVCRVVHARRPHHLVTYLQQLTIPSSGLVSPQGSSLHRLAWLALQAQAASWAVGVQVALVADGSFARPLGMGAGSAIRAHPSDSAVVCVRVWAPPCLPWELEGRHGLNLVGGSSFNVVGLLFLPAAMWSVYIILLSQRFLINKRCAGNLPPEVQRKWVRVSIHGG